MFLSPRVQTWERSRSCFGDEMLPRHMIAVDWEGRIGEWPSWNTARLLRYRFLMKRRTGTTGEIHVPPHATRPDWILDLTMLPDTEDLSDVLWRCDNSVVIEDLNPKNIEPTRRNKFRTTKPKMNELADRLAFSTYQPHSELAPGRKVPRRNSEKSWGELHFKTCERPPSGFGERWK